ncbi:hypothetical protein POSPLADRAFT_1136478 [Postia placenta MAD-698-R-SB12]|uniref:Cytochrome P450 n=2 Tax=Rhodonia placenta TaxID=104341 RepID=A0A1X6N8A2_9APHY|nr:hypothetical protein POSPLADRAFT_1136478 [Postia placenta MAD-698-R-SB12]OSX64686.1 hypothetical protein POSPLADRAFT_1136478 [Postia placenta MAD-698-R-SB12]BAK09534.1 cytochrome P450 [Postia placenta]
MIQTPVYTALCCLLVLVAARLLGKRSSHLPMPPGPRGLPVLGNALQMPREREWITFAKWAKTYGDIMHLSVFGRHIIVLSSPDVILDLLEKRSTIYSDRPFFTMASEFIGFDKFVVMEPYGNRLREGRKLIQGNINARSASRLQQVQISKVSQLLPRILRDNSNLRMHIRWYVAAVIFQVSHGRTIDNFDDPFVRLAEASTEDFARSVRPGAYLVDNFPFLKYVPDWVPGTGWKAVAKQRKHTLARLRDEPFEYVKQQLAQGTAPPSVTASVIESNPKPNADDAELQRTSTAILYASAADTTVSALESFFLIMGLYPEVQKKAQAELDTVVEAGKLPDYNDRPNLPYVNALIKEILRWNPVLPLALPHSLMQDDEYRGYHIPKGSTIFANSWAVMHDPSLYPDPFEVRPERYLSPSAALNPDPRTFAFGYGRRACPGQILAEDSLFIIVVRVLSTMTIERALGTNNLPVEYTSGAISHPTTMDCKVTARSTDAEKLILGVE